MRKKARKTSKHLPITTMLASLLLLCSGPWMLLCSGSVLRDKMTVLQDPDDDDRRVVVVAWRDGDQVQCQMFTDQKLIQEVLQSSPGDDDDLVRRPTHEEMAVIRDECEDSYSESRRRRQAEDDDDATSADDSDSRWNVIFPGTKWCGNGDIAETDDDLGTNVETDKCCRAHDKCDDYLLAGETKYNLTNKSSFTKLNCKCDDSFYECLSNVNNLVSNTVGNTYFNLLRRRCFQIDHPIGKKCVKNTSKLKITCLEYERDTSAPKVHQWVSAKIFRQLPVPGPLDVKLRIDDERMKILRKYLP